MRAIAALLCRSIVVWFVTEGRASRVSGRWHPFGRSCGRVPRFAHKATWAGREGRSPRLIVLRAPTCPSPQGRSLKPVAKTHFEGSTRGGRDQLHATAVAPTGNDPGERSLAAPYLSRSSLIHSAANVLFTVPTERAARASESGHPLRPGGSRMPRLRVVLRGREGLSPECILRTPSISPRSAFPLKQIARSFAES